MSREIFAIAQLMIGLLFLYSALAKLKDQGAYVAAIVRYVALPARVARLAGFALIIAELLVAGAHLTGIQMLWVAPATVLLLGVFLAVVLQMLHRHTDAPCLCFGTSSSQRVSKLTVSRIAVLIAVECSLRHHLNVSGLSSATAPLSPQELLAALVAAGLVCVCALWVFALGDILAIWNAPKGRAHSRQAAE